MSDPEPVFEIKTQADRQLVICTFGEFTGTARVFTAGVDEAKQRAEKQARAKAAKAAQE